MASSGPQETLSVAKNWLRHCLENHKCHQSLFVPRRSGNTPQDLADAIDERSTFYPTRLLDLRVFGDDCPDIRLIESPAPGSPFATLSHCWGGDTKCQATTRTIHNLRDRILYTGLPQTYRDAIAVCRFLSIRYLWIDSLCIIQDSQEDWAREAARMSYVYSNTHVTISADWSPNSEGGCFKDLSKQPVFEAERMVCINGVLSSGQQSYLYVPSWPFSDHHDLDSTHLAGRAWAFQERFLSRRNLHFTRNQLFWECREGFAGEDMVPRLHGALIPGQLLEMRSQETLEDRLHAWCLVVRNYSRAKITFSTDRLPAISALAKLCADDLCSPYLAGLWLEGLWYTLCWFRRLEIESIEKPKDYIAPSWSWCSVNSDVNFLITWPSITAIKRVEVLDAFVQPIGDPFGQVSRGWICLRGHIAENLFQLRTLGHGREYTIYPDYPREPPPPNIYWLLLGETALRVSGPLEYYFLLVVISSIDSNVYERWGMGATRSAFVSEQWPEKTITII
ncbi:HET-domain-containing protein [Stipitochalara longipes BDJ]|nr:HET-domain-containing protein [Stipitochalara longipes BDJ]